MGKRRDIPQTEHDARALMNRVLPQVLSQFSTASQDRACRHYAATEIHFYPNGAAVVSSPHSGTEYTIDPYGNCECAVKRSAFCWHGLAIAMRLIDKD